MQWCRAVPAVSKAPCMSGLAARCFGVPRLPWLWTLWYRWKEFLVSRAGFSSAQCQLGPGFLRCGACSMHDASCTAYWSTLSTPVHSCASQVAAWLAASGAWGRKGMFERVLLLCQPGADGSMLTAALLPCSTACHRQQLMASQPTDLTADGEGALCSYSAALF